MRIALIQQSIIAGDKKANYVRVSELVSEAISLPETVPDVIVLPELWSTGLSLIHI